MNITSSIFRKGGFSAELFLTDGQHSVPKFFNVWKGSATSKVSSFIKLSIQLDGKGKPKKVFKKEETDINEAIFLSTFDLYKFNKVVKKLIKFYDSEYWTVKENMEMGSVMEIPNSKRNVVIFKNSTDKSVIAFSPTILYRRKADEYIPSVSIYISRDDVAVVLDRDSFLAFLYSVLNFDLFGNSTMLVSSFLASRQRTIQPTKIEVE